MKATTYGPGGYDASKPDGNVVEEREIEVEETPEEQADRELLEAIQAARSLAELKDALLGRNGKGRIRAVPNP